MLRCLPLLLLTASALAAQTPQWRPEEAPPNVRLESQSTASGFDRFRATVVVCTDLKTVADYTADVSTLKDWVAYAEAVELLESDQTRTLYYLKSAAPWPMRSRDMVYQLTPRFDAAGLLHISMIGMPDAVPLRPDAVRMHSVEGDWLFRVEGSEITVQLTLLTDPGKVPKFMANRRIARTIGLTLEALGEKFPCSTALNVPD